MYVMLCAVYTNVMYVACCCVCKCNVMYVVDAVCNVIHVMSMLYVM